MPSDAPLLEVVESDVVAKADPGACEDRLVVDERDGAVAFVAVVDGATDKAGRTFDGRAGGWLAAEAVAGAIADLPPEISPPDAVRELTAAVASVRAGLGIPDGSTTAPTAAVAVVSVARREVWRVGDVHVAVRLPGGERIHPADKHVDVAAGLARAAYTHALLAAGTPGEEVLRDDPGRTFITPLLELQGALANSEVDSPFAYGVIDGTPVPDGLVEVIPVDRAACEVVVASDGYLSPAPTLAAAEAELEADVRTDPMRIGAHPGTKGVRPGAAGFDDRTYVRLRFAAA